MKRMIQEIKKRWQLIRICRALGIKPKRWQWKVAMAKPCRIPTARRTGKTTAVILRAILEKPQTARGLYNLLMIDPDFHRGYSIKIETYDNFRKSYEVCRRKGVIVGKTVDMKAFREETAKRGRFDGLRIW